MCHQSVRAHRLHHHGQAVLVSPSLLGYPTRPNARVRLFSTPRHGTPCLICPKIVCLTKNSAAQGIPSFIMNLACAAIENEFNPKSAEVVFKHALMIAPWPTFSRVSSSGGYPRRCSRPRSPCIGSCRWVLCVGLPVWLCEISIQLLN